MNRTESRKTRRTKEEVQLANMSTDELFQGCEEAFQKLTKIKAELKVRFQSLPTNLINELLSQNQVGTASTTAMPRGLNSINSGHSLNRVYEQPMLIAGSNATQQTQKPVSPLSPNQDSFIQPLSPEQQDLDNQFNHLQTTINSKMAHLQRVNQMPPDAHSSGALVTEEGVAPF